MQRVSSVTALLFTQRSCFAFPDWLDCECMSWQMSEINSSPYFCSNSCFSLVRFAKSLSSPIFSSQNLTTCSQSLASLFWKVVISLSSPDCSFWSFVDSSMSSAFLNLLSLAAVFILDLVGEERRERTKQGTLLEIL